MNPWKPTARQLVDAESKTLRDVLRAGLDVVMVGINPGLYTAAVGHHFARPGNRFWPALHAGGFTPRLYSPFEDERLLELGIGLTNVVARATARADVLTDTELREGGILLRDKLREHRPRFVAFLGLGAYRAAFHRAKAVPGPQDERMEGARTWLLPNPSGLNAHYSAERLARMFRELKAALDA